MAILYATEQGSYLAKSGNRIVVRKGNTTIHWVHAFNLKQIVIMGYVGVSPGLISFLLHEGIDTVFLSMHGKYQGRLISEAGKNIDLRRRQFAQMEKPDFRLKHAKLYVQGKLANCRTALRKWNKDLDSAAVTETIHKLRRLGQSTESAQDVNTLMGLEGAGAAAYFGCFPHLLRGDDIVFNGRNRRPPKDPVNVLLSLGYTLLANVTHTQVNVTGLDPYMGCLHSIEYGRPSLALDLMEEFRPVIVDTLVIKLINRRIIRLTDFYKPEDREPAAFPFAEDEAERPAYPIILGHEGMRKFIMAFEDRLRSHVMYLPTAKRLTYRDIMLEQVRLFIRALWSEAEYTPYPLR